MALPLPMDTTFKVLKDVYNVLAASVAGTAPLKVEAELEVGDLEIGAVEIKNADTDDRAKVAATSSVAEDDIVMAVQAPVLGATDGAALDADGSGTLQQYLRGILKRLFGTLETPISSGDMSANITGSVVTINGRKNSAVQIHADSGTHIGTLEIDFSNDVTFAIYETTTLDETPTAPSGSAWDDGVELENRAWAYLRPRYVFTSGTGSLDVTVALS